jgi:hypothetical protein
MNPHFSRRRLLASLGVSAAVAPFLPRLESLAGERSSPRRFFVFFTPHGTIRDRWLPTGSETDFVLPQILEPLAPLQDRLVVVDGLSVKIGGPPGGPHTVGPSYVMTGSPMLEGDEFVHSGAGGPHGWASSISIDQAIADAIGTQTPFKSLEFGVQTGGNHPGSRISYAGPSQPLAPEPDPFAMFERIFGKQGIDPAVANAVRAERLAVLDAVKPELDAVMGQVSQLDRMKIEAHLAGIEQMQAQLAATYDCAPPELGPAVDLGDWGNADAITAQQIDLAVAAFACGATNVASLMMRRGENDGFPYPFAGLDVEHHLSTHAGDSDTATWDELALVYRWYAEQVAALATKLDAIVEPDGTTMLDNTVILWASEIAKGNNHAWDDMPFVLVGGGGGAIETGRFVSYPGVNHCRLLVTLARAFGLELDTFGGFDDGSGPLPGLLV